MNALLIVDVQNDFCPGGALAVQKGDQIIPIINRISPLFDVVVLTQDWHPTDHSSFASMHSGKKAYDTVEQPYGTQMLWPDHCVQESYGAAFHHDLDTQQAQLIIRKGFRKAIDSYSAFYENDQQTVTGLNGFLQNRNIKDLYVVGLATDFCVKWSAIDGVKEGFSVSVIEDATKGIDLDNSVEKAWKEMQNAGVKRISSDQLKLHV